MTKSGSLLGLSLCILGLSAPAEAVQAQQSSLLWEIRNPKTDQRSYLFGTMHVFSEELQTLTAPLEAYISSCDATVFEIDFDQQRPEHSAQLMSTDKPLDAFLDSACYQRLIDLYGSALEIPEHVLKQMSPLAILLMPYMRFVPEFSEQGMDAYYFDRAKSLNKIIIALESIDEQIAVSMRMQYDPQTLASLCKMVAQKDPIGTMMSDFQTMLALYQSQDIEQLLRLSQEQTGTGVMQDMLIHERNALMFERLKPHLQNNTSLFILVGAAHLAGEQGLIQLLRNDGYEMRPLNL